MEEVVSNLKKCAVRYNNQIVDSGSTDGTVELASEAGFKVMKIRSEDFNHGGTRNLAVSEYLNEFDIAIFLTQDAIPEKGFIEEIIRSFNDPLVVCAYGRQLPHEDANPIAQHARFFSYPSTSKINDMTTVSNNGIKTVFMSNSFRHIGYLYLKSLVVFLQILSFVRICFHNKSHTLWL
ncbi:hypothetical protein BANRA_01648 [Klebsiella pneumoniae]|nr:glycosyltransferase [Klebsiella pneumoniae]VDA63350.1 hypothetical protein BANRA_01648 [Klebsiella pneumoniae]